MASGDDQKGYTQGYSKSFTSSHTSRTAEVDAAFVLPLLKPKFRILDVGCGPGTISCGLAQHVPQGSVMAVDISPQVLIQAREQKSKMPDGGPSNIDFKPVDILQTPFSSSEDDLSNDKVAAIPKEWEGSFDVIYASQCFLHLSDPCRAIHHLKQCLRPHTGILCSRDHDAKQMLFWPDPTGKLQKWNDGMYKMFLAGGSPSGYGGRDLPRSYTKAGWNRNKITIGASTVVYQTPEERKWWGGLHADRWSAGEQTRKIMLEKTDYTVADCDDVVEALRDWIQDPDGYFAAMAIEVIARV